MTIADRIGRVRVVAWFFVALALAPLLRAQQPPDRTAPPGVPTSPPGVEQGAPLTPGEVMRLFDAYAVMQAQDALKLDDAQYARFIPKYRTLLETQRRLRSGREGFLRDLARLSRTNGGTADEAALRDRLKALDDYDGKAQTELKQALDAVDEVLTLPQRARFRVFEEQMDRRKIDLLTRARQANRSEPRRPRGR